MIDFNRNCNLVFVRGGRRRHSRKGRKFTKRFDVRSGVREAGSLNERLRSESSVL